MSKSKSSSVINWSGKFFAIKFDKIKNILRTHKKAKMLHNFNIKKVQLLNLPNINPNKYIEIVKQPFMEKECEIHLHDEGKKIHKIKSSNFTQTIIMFKLIGFILYKYRETKIETWAFGDSIIMTYNVNPLIEPFLEISGTNEKDLLELFNVLKLNKKSAIYKTTEELYSDALGVSSNTIDEILKITFNNYSEIYMKYAKKNKTVKKKRVVRRRRRPGGELM